MDNRYLFVSRKNATGRKEEDSRSRRLYVTNDYSGAEVKFSEVQLPSLQDEQVRAWKSPQPEICGSPLNCAVLCCDGHT